MSYNKKITKTSKFYRNAIKLIRSHNIKYRMNWRSKSCYAYPEDSFIHIGCKNMSIKRFLSAVYHEIQHVFNLREGKYRKYHSLNSITKRKDIKRVLRTAVRAEKYTDKIAKKYMQRHYPNVPYEGYTEETIRWFKENHLPRIKDLLEGMVDYYEELLYYFRNESKR